MEQRVKDINKLYVKDMDTWRILRDRQTWSELVEGLCTKWRMKRQKFQAPPLRDNLLATSHPGQYLVALHELRSASENALSVCFYLHEVHSKSILLLLQ